MPSITYILDSCPRRRLPYSGLKRGKGQRAYAAPPTALVWTRGRQARAIKLGMFLERVTPSNHVHVVSLSTAREQDAMDRLERLAFHMDGFALTALAFIEQQDQFGYSGVWDPAIERYSPHLRWLKQDAIRERKYTDEMSRHMQKVAQSRWGKFDVGKKQEYNV